MNSIIFSWKLQKGSYLEAMTIPPKHIDFAKDNLACNISTKNDVESGSEAKDDDGE